MNLWVAMQLAKLPKENSSRPRVVVITQGKDPTVVATEDKVMAMLASVLLLHNTTQ